MPLGEKRWSWEASDAVCFMEQPSRGSEESGKCWHFQMQVPNLTVFFFKAHFLVYSPLIIFYFFHPSFTLWCWLILFWLSIICNMFVIYHSRKRFEVAFGFTCSSIIKFDTLFLSIISCSVPFYHIPVTTAFILFHLLYSVFYSIVFCSVLLHSLYSVICFCVPLDSILFFFSFLPLHHILFCSAPFCSTLLVSTLSIIFYSSPL